MYMPIQDDDTMNGQPKPNPDPNQLRTEGGDHTTSALTPGCWSGWIRGGESRISALHTEGVNARWHD